MHSIRTKITFLMLAAMLINILTFGMIGIYYISAESRQMSSQTLNLICENRRDSLNEYLNSIQQSVSMISRYAADSLDSVALTDGGVLGASGSGVKEIPGRSEEQREELDRYLDGHLELIENVFMSIANHTNGLSSCYYRINPEITSSPKGFFFTKTGSYDFQKIEMTDIGAYDPEDIDNVGWYYIPLRQGRPSWIKPYHSVKMDDWVISYAVPLFKAGTFIGVIGMDIRFDTLKTQIQSFTNFRTGFFALTDEKGRICYHPDIEMGKDLADELPQLSGIIEDLNRDSSSEKVIRYSKNGSKWQMTYTTLVNGLKLFAVVQQSEINTYLNNMTRVFIITGSLLLLAFVIFTTVSMKRVTDPLKRLTLAAKKLASGDYEAQLDYDGDDEVGVLTSTFASMRDRLKANISDLTEKAFKDGLTGVKSRHAYSEDIKRLNLSIESHSAPRFAVALFDLNNLKSINDMQGHDAGDEFIKEACALICSRFKHSPVYRIGGDEFVVLIEGADYDNLDELISGFEAMMDANLREGKPTVSSGNSCFDPEHDESFRSVFNRADEKMYERKHMMKKAADLLS